MSIFQRLFIFFFLILNQTFAAPKPAIRFVRNDGQWDASIRYRAEIHGGYLFIKDHSIHYTFYDTQALADLHLGNKNAQNTRKIEGIRGHGVEVEFMNANQKSQIEAQNSATFHHNYFIGNDPANWRSNVPVYEEVYLKEIYPNIDLKLYSLDQSLKYEYIVKPNGDASKIRMKYRGMDELSVDNQRVKIKTSVNVISELEPFTFQNNQNNRREIQSKYHLDNNEISFDLDEYDHSKELIIDPQIVFSTYSGAISDNWSQTATYDDEGNLYAGGTIFGANFPTTLGAFQTNVAGAASPSAIFAGITDVVIMKFSSDGSKLLYSTFLGGRETEVPHSLVVNKNGQLVIFGTTSSTNFPMLSPIQRSFGGGVPYADGTSIGFANGSDIFVTVLSKDGKNLIGSTYLGGSNNDGYNNTSGLDIRNYGDEFRGEVAVDDEDNIYVSSVTNSTNFPLKNAVQNSRISTTDAVVFKLNANASQLLFSTYLGGNGFDAGYGIQISKLGTFYVCGTTQSTNLATKTGAFSNRNLGNSDGFIAKFNKDYSLNQITYIGTDKVDIAYFLDLDADENIHVFGQTRGLYPTTFANYQNARSGQFVDCLDKNLSKRVFATVIGTGRAGEVDIVPTAFLVNRCGNIYLAGWGGKVNHKEGFNLKSTTTGLPTTNDAYQKTTTGNNFYLMILEKGAKSLLYATFFGSTAPPMPAGEAGDHVDGGTCRFDKRGIIYHSACACKSRQGAPVATFPTVNAWQKNHQSDNCNLAAFKFDIDNLRAKFDVNDGSKTNVTEICIPQKLNFANQSVGAKNYEWFIDGKKLSELENVREVNFQNVGEYKVKLIAYNNTSCLAADTTERIIKARGFQSSARGDTTVCSNSEVRLFSTGPADAKYVWNPSVNISNFSLPNTTAKVNATTTFTVTISKDGCEAKRDVTIKVDDSKPDFIASGGKEICRGNSVQLTARGSAQSITWTATGMADSTKASITVNPSRTTTYTAKGIYADGCRPTASTTVTIDESHKPDFDFLTNQACNKPLELAFTNKTINAERFVWQMGNGESLTSRIPENYKYSKAGNYTITLKSYNKIGCELITTKVISVPDSDGSVPNVVTPNGDGKNDSFIIGIPNSTMKIYNRWGKLVFESPNYQNDWGKGVVNGTYYYILISPVGEECKGVVTVLE
jgi:gliding motility-associated-like protein